MYTRVINHKYQRIIAAIATITPECSQFPSVTRLLFPGQGRIRPFTTADLRNECVKLTIHRSHAIAPSVPADPRRAAPAQGWKRTRSACKTRIYRSFINYIFIIFSNYRILKW